MVQGYYNYNYNNPYSRYSPMFRANDDFLATPIKKVSQAIESGVEPFADPNEKPSNKKRRKRIIAASSTVLVLGAMTMIANPKSSTKVMSKLKNLQSEFEIKMNQNKDKFLKGKLYEFGHKIVSGTKKGANVYYNFISGKDIVFQEMCLNANKKYPEFLTKNKTTHEIIKALDNRFVKIFEKPHKKITEWFDNISKATVKRDYRRATRNIDLLNEEFQLLRKNLSPKNQKIFDAKFKEIISAKEVFNEKEMLDRLKEQEKMMDFLPEDLWNKVYNKKDGFAKTITESFWVRDALSKQKTLVENQGEQRLLKLFGNKDKKGLYDDLVDLLKKDLKPDEIKLLEKDMAETLAKLRKANESECIKYFDKKRDLSVGSAPTDVLWQLLGLGLCGWTVARADKEDRTQALVTKGLPIITGLGSMLVFSALLYTAGASLAAGVGVSAVTGIIGNYINKHLLGNNDESLDDQINVNNQTNLANQQSKLKGVIYA